MWVEVLFQRRIQIFCTTRSNNKLGFKLLAVAGKVLQSKVLISEQWDPHWRLRDQKMVVNCGWSVEPWRSPNLRTHDTDIATSINCLADWVKTSVEGGSIRRQQLRADQCHLSKVRRWYISACLLYQPAKPHTLRGIVVIYCYILLYIIYPRTCYTRLQNLTPSEV